MRVRMILKKVLLILLFSCSTANAQTIEQATEIASKCEIALEDGETDLISIYAQKLTGLVLPQDQRVIKKVGQCILIGSRLKFTSTKNLNVAPMLRSIESHKRSLKGLCNSLFDRSPASALRHNLCRAIILE